MNKSESSSVDLRDLFLGLQKQMLTKLQTNRKVIKHPVTKGDSAEVNWTEMLSGYLPERYKIKKAFVLDSKGKLSEQLDIVIFDRQYSPFLFNQDDALYIPAESVYSVIEVKHNIGKTEINYAADKIASVRQLHRTSGPVPTVNGIQPPKKPHTIIGGIVSLESNWNPPLGDPFMNVIQNLTEDKQIDLGCILNSVSFSITYQNSKNPLINESGTDNSLIFFFMELLTKLQNLATAPLIVISEYAKSL